MLRVVLPISAVTVFAIGMSLMILSAAALSPPGSGVIPAALAFVAVGLLGSVVMIVVSAQERRIQELERRLRSLEDQDAEPTEQRNQALEEVDQLSSSADR